MSLPYSDPNPGVAWYRTTFTLDEPSGVDASLGLTINDASTKAYRATIFLNGWNLGQYINHVGPQHTFVLPNGILHTGIGDDGKNTLLAATYDFGVAKAHFAYGTNRGTASSPLRNTANPFGYAFAPTASTDSNDLLLGATVPFGANKVLVSYVRKDDRTAANQDAHQWALGYLHSLSKRTDLYAAYAKISNSNGAGYTVGSAIEAGSGDSAFQFGMRHSF